MSDEPIHDPQPIEPPPKQPWGEGVVELNSEVRNWAMLAHLASLAKYTAVPLANILGPLVVWLIKKDEMPFVDDQGKEAINFQISVTVYGLVSGVLAFCTAGIGLIFVIAVLIYDLVFTILAAVSAANGKAYRYPLTLRLLT
jgi:uncharacterized Tic20 family protein